MTRLKLFAPDKTHGIVMCRLPSNLDLAQAMTKGWCNKKQMAQKLNKSEEYVNNVAVEVRHKGGLKDVSDKSVRNDGLPPQGS